MIERRWKMEEEMVHDRGGEGAGGRAGGEGAGAEAFWDNFPWSWSSKH